MKDKVEIKGSEKGWVVALPFPTRNQVDARILAECNIPLQ